jgi:hypothetical protein
MDAVGSDFTDNGAVVGYAYTGGYRDYHVDGEFHASSSRRAARS